MMKFAVTQTPVRKRYLSRENVDVDKKGTS